MLCRIVSRLDFPHPIDFSNIVQLFINDPTRGYIGQLYNKDFY